MSNFLLARKLVTHSIESLNVHDMFVNAKLQFPRETTVAPSSPWARDQGHSNARITKAPSSAREVDSSGPVEGMNTEAGQGQSER